MTLLRPQPIVHIQDVIVLLVIVSIVEHSLGRFREDATRVVGDFVPELRVAGRVG